MLAESVRDDTGVEGPRGAEAGLGLLPVRTTLEFEKRTRRDTGSTLVATVLAAAATPVAGYEIHLGSTVPVEGTARQLTAFVALAVAGGQMADGAVGDDGRVVGTYIHGLFESAPFCADVLGHLSARRGWAPPAGVEPWPLALSTWFLGSVDVAPILRWLSS